MPDRIDGKRSLLPCQSHRFIPYQRNRLSVHAIPCTAGSPRHPEASEAERSVRRPGSLVTQWDIPPTILGCLAQTCLGQLANLIEISQLVDSGLAVRTSAAVATSD